jgi:hypothetical protein
VHAQRSYDYAVIRVVPRVERQEFVNAGVIVWCKEQDFLEARIELDEQRVRMMDHGVEIDAVHRHLDSISVICAGGAGSGPIGKLTKRERFDWLVAPRSTIIQTSAVHTGRCDDLAATLERLLDSMVRPLSGNSGAGHPAPLLDEDGRLF